VKKTCKYFRNIIRTKSRLSVLVAGLEYNVECSPSVERQCATENALCIGLQCLCPSDHYRYESGNQCLESKWDWLQYCLCMLSLPYFQKAILSFWEKLLWSFPHLYFF